MSDPVRDDGAGLPVSPTAAAPVGPLADGEWHRLHPLTPLLRGGVALIAVIGILIATLRDRLIVLFFPAPGEPDIIDLIVDNELVVVVILGGLGVLAVAIGGFWLSWRFSSFRVTDDAVEMRRGVLLRTHRQARLDRIQGIAVQRPVLARLVGASKLQIEVAGQGSGVDLSFLKQADAEQLHRDVLRLASGARRGQDADGTDAADPAAASATAGARGIIQQRIGEFTELDRDYRDIDAPSLVVLPIGRIIGSVVMSGNTVWVLVAIAATIVASVLGTAWFAVAVVPIVIAGVGVAVRMLTRSVNYHIAATPDGIRIGSGVLGQRSETVPPGRVHVVEVRQPFLWRPMGWWQIRINRALGAMQQAASGGQSSIVLPVGTRAETDRVLALLLEGLTGETEPEALIAAGLAAKPGDDGYRVAPRSASVLHPISRRRRGVAIGARSVYLRTGRFARALVIIPLARLQSVGIAQGPIERMLGLASLHPHTVAGVVGTRFGALGLGQVDALFTELARGAVTAASADRSHRWRRQD